MSDGAIGSMTAIDVCICTFKRASLSTTLASIARQQGHFGKVRVILADNDDTPSALPIVNEARGNGQVITYVHAPARNISIARNACLDAASAPLIAWIDDDEIADPDWLSQLVEALGNHDAAFGRVIADYPSQAPDWIIAADLHSTLPVQTTDGVVTGYTSNAIVRLAAVGEERFAEELGRSGGEDTDFFARLYRNGSRYAAAPLAVVREPTADSRLSLRWLSQRSFRSGQTHARAYLANGQRVRGVIEAGLKAAFCMAISFVSVADGVKSRRYW
ncbi:hypothetical protein LTR94_025900, partial [Friedmanniomyces endolithicus]